MLTHEDLNVQANLVFFYYKDLASAQDFYANTLGLEMVLDYGFAKLFRISQTTYVGLVDERVQEVSESRLPERSGEVPLDQFVVARFGTTVRGGVAAERGVLEILAVVHRVGRDDDGHVLAELPFMALQRRGEGICEVIGQDRQAFPRHVRREDRDDRDGRRF